MNDYKVLKVTDQNDINDLEKFYSNFSYAEQKDLKFDFKNELFFKIIDNKNEIIGIASVSDEDYTYDNLKRFIKPEMRGKKLADFLLDKIIEIAKIEKKIRLTGYYKSSEEKAKEYFIEKGFKVIDKSLIIDNVEFSNVLLKLSSINK
ncbi:GNAT family N-acetyltransferase [Flavobacterium panacagri]|uniref:GNAT family N-acetyltransferase n=1 Tax=Flavobacterium panacagri TaxID=3034146 RepID=UPI0025A53446|nr:GNAT family N-acetyltransferase [Flavobacterium panacagri]